MPPHFKKGVNLERMDKFEAIRVKGMGLDLFTRTFLIIDNIEKCYIDDILDLLEFDYWKVGDQYQGKDCKGLGLEFIKIKKKDEGRFLNEALEMLERKLEFFDREEYEKLEDATRSVVNEMLGEEG